MNQLNTYLLEIKSNLKTISTPEKAEASRRYFPHGIHCIGANAADIKFVISEFQASNPNLNATQMLAVTEYLLQNAEYSEETMVAFGLINKFVKQHYDESLLLRFEFWLENYATNWSLVDDLCIKTIYNFFMARPELITSTQHWTYSNAAWCRRASNVVWVKFVKRKMGKATYCLEKELIFKNCTILMSDEDEFVQKSIGWLLKVTSQHHEKDVIAYIEQNYNRMPRSTIRYAIEKMDAPTRKKLLTITT